MSEISDQELIQMLMRNLDVARNALDDIFYHADNMCKAKSEHVSAGNWYAEFVEVRRLARDGLEGSR